VALPGFVRLGLLAVATQVVFVGGTHIYFGYRHPVDDAVSRRRSTGLLFGGVGVAALGQLAALGAIGSLRVTPLLSFETALALQDAGLLVTGVGYVGVLAGLVVRVRAAD
jgi:hypothetical protein